MLKKWSVMLLCLMVLTSFSACGGNSEPANASGENSAEADEQNTEKLQVSVTFDAMKEFVAAVGKDKVEITTIIPAGTEAHDFEPKAQDLANLSTSALFVYNGLGMDEWAEEALTAVNTEDLFVVEASKGADIIENEHEDDDHEGEEHEDEEHEGEEHEGEEHEDEGHHHHGKYDPHLWLSLKGAQTAATNVKDGLVQADPSNKDYYEQNCAEFIEQLETLYNEYSEKFQSVSNKSFVTGHAAFAYLCRDFGLEQNSVSDTFAEGEPSAQQLANLVEYCKTNQVTTIFAEELASPEVSETLANEVGAKVETIYTIESAQDDMTYLERMESNLSKIYDSLNK